MWKDPGIALDYEITLLWKCVLASDVWDREHGKVPDFHGSRAGHQLIVEAFHEFKSTMEVCFAQIAKGQGDLLADNPHRVFRSRISKWLLEAVRRFEGKGLKEFKGYQEASSIWSIFNANELWVVPLACAIHLLLGDERRFLIGTRGGVPTYKVLNTRLTGKDQLQYLTEHWPIDTDMCYLGPGEVQLVPDPTERSKLLNDPEEWIPLHSINPIADVLSDAYYNQYYFLHPEGSYIKLGGGSSTIKGVTLKAVQGLDDPNYLDFFGRFHLSDGDAFISLSSMIASGQKEDLNSAYGVTVTYGFLKLAMAQIYHDIVTVRRLPETPPGRGQEPLGFDKRVDRTDRIWRYIPRVITDRSNSERIRQPMCVPRVSEPHEVTGHPRRGNMSETQREVICKFEEQYGFEIFSLLRRREEEEGCSMTWVQPHMSPRAEPDVIRKLPHFVRARLQRDIARKILNTE